MIGKSAADTSLACLARTRSQEAMKTLLDPEPLLVSEPAPFRLAPVN